MTKTLVPVEVPPELKSKVNAVKSRILFLSPSVMSGQERECRRDDFESLANSNIGVGGFGKVYKVRHKVSQMVYAIKVINKQKIIEHDLVEQIKLEVEIMYKLNHPYIVKLYNHYEDDDSFYLILEYAPKGQIYTLIKREGRFSERVSAQYLREVISACQYLHSLDPPIIHRDIKPENILLDQEGAVKLADFGWSNFFNDGQEQKRQTYCGTPEYLAPEMIKQSGHDKSLDIWNLGVLLFELLTGAPPFEGANQSVLFENILNHRVKWPARFNAMAKDLIQKLLKTNPSERIKLDEINEHPWFKANPAIRPVHQVNGKQQASLVGSVIKPQDYKVISTEKKPERQSLLAIKLDQIQSEQNDQLKEALSKLQTQSTEAQELRQQLHRKQQEVDKLQTDKLALQKELGLGQQSAKDLELKRLQDELMVQKSINKNRQELLAEVDQKNQLVRQLETQLQLARNDITVQEQSAKTWQDKYHKQAVRLEEVEKKMQFYKEQSFQSEQQKEQLTIESEARIAFLNHKLLAGLGNPLDQDAQHAQFIELMNLCRHDVQDLVSKVTKQLSSETIEADKLRAELIEQGRQFGQVKLQYEAKITATKQSLSQQYTQDLAQLKTKYEEIVVKQEQELQAKEARVKALERQEKQQLMARDAAKGLEEQIKILSERVKNIQTDRDLLDQEKRMGQELLAYKEQQIKGLKDKLSEHGL